MSSPPPPLTVDDVERGAAALAAVDADLGRVVERLGPPPLSDRLPGFSTLVRIILEQQVSLASARAAFDKLVLTLPELDPETFVTLGDGELKAMGFSGQKGRYCRALARAVNDGELCLDDLVSLPDDAVSVELEKVVGIGPWTACTYLLMVLRRPDVWPPGDLALAAAARDLKGLAHRPAPRELEAIAEQWRPWRSVAARILWHHYLNPE